MKKAMLVMMSVFTIAILVDSFAPTIEKAPGKVQPRDERINKHKKDIEEAGKAA